MGSSWTRESLLFIFKQLNLNLNKHRTILHRIKTLALGPNFRHAKFAARILAFSGQGQDDKEKDDEEIMKEREENCVGVVEVCIPILSLFFSDLTKKTTFTSVDNSRLPSFRPF